MKREISPTVFKARQICRGEVGVAEELCFAELAWIMATARAEVGGLPSTVADPTAEYKVTLGPAGMAEGLAEGLAAAYKEICQGGNRKDRVWTYQ